MVSSILTWPTVKVDFDLGSTLPYTNSMSNYTEDEFKAAVAKSYSVASTLRELNLVAAGGNYRSFHRLVAKYNVDTSHFTGQGWNRGQVHGTKYPLEEYLSNKRTISSHTLRLRLIKEGIFEQKCYSCNLTEWLGQPIALELEHINGVHEDNTLNNLTLLCPNCHAQTSTYRGKNQKRRGGVAELDYAGDLKSLSKERNLNAGSNPAAPTLCKDCGKIIGAKFKQCGDCHSTKRCTKINWPSKEELLERLTYSNYSKLGRELGVSDNAIRKYLAR